MAQDQEESREFTGFGLGAMLEPQAEAGVFILAIFRDGSLTATAHATELSAMESAVQYLGDERADDDDEGGTLQDLFARAQRIIADEGAVMEIIPSPVYG